MARQLHLQDIWKESANSVARADAGSPHGSHLIKRVRLRDYPIASSKANYLSEEHLGYQMREKIYFLCPFHRERTPSCVWYPKGSAAAQGSFPSRWSHFHCYGCGKTGNIHTLLKGLADPHYHLRSSDRISPYLKRDDLGIDRDELNRREEDNPF